MRKIYKTLLTSFLLLITTIIIAPTRTEAFSTKVGDNVNIGSGEIIEETLLATGNNITIENNVKGDILCAGRNINIKGNVEGDIICAGQHITIDGNVTGSVRAAAQNIIINGQVMRNITTFAQDITNNAKVDGEMFFAGQHLNMEGAIGGDLQGAGESVNLNGKVGRNVNLSLGKLNIGKNSIIGGDVIYESKNDAVVSQGATIPGHMTRKIPSKNWQKTSGWKPATNNWIWNKSGSLAVDIVAAVLLILLFPKTIERVTAAMTKNSGKSIGIGTLLLLSTPFAALLILITIIGIPVSALLIIAYIAAIFTSRILVMVMLGKKITQDYWKEKKDSLMISALIGVVLSWIIFSLPVLGWVASLIAVLWGMGGVYYLFRPAAKNS